MSDVVATVPARYAPVVKRVAPANIEPGTYAVVIGDDERVGFDWSEAFKLAVQTGGTIVEYVAVQS